jgi:ATP-dependent helicase/nuclease subunit B
MQDPYTTYARHILKLRPLEGLDCPLDPRLFGTWVHKICERIVFPTPLTVAGFLKEGAQCLKALMGSEKALAHPTIQLFWWPRLEQIGAWFVKEETKRREWEGAVPQTFTELKGRLELPHTRGVFTLRARADRLDIFPDGSGALMDYKTGQLPGTADPEKGEVCQLLLEAGLLLKGGFGLQVSDIRGLSYWHMVARQASVRSLPWPLPQAAFKALENLQAYIETFNDPRTPYLPRGMVKEFSDYGHLARLEAWRGV